LGLQVDDATPHDLAVMVHRLDIARTLIEVERLLVGDRQLVARSSELRNILPQTTLDQPRTHAAESRNRHTVEVYDEWGIADGYHDVNGQWHATNTDVRQHLRSLMGEPTAGDPMWFVERGAGHRLMSRCHLTLDDGVDLGEFDALPTDLPVGYHRLQPLDGGPITTLVVAPAACPAAPTGWGVAAQVYSLWRPDGWGIGDLRDVELLAQRVAALGASVLLLSPLHAPAPTRPQEPSPYYPSSRRWLNPLLIPMRGDTPGELSNDPTSLIDRDRVWGAVRQHLAQRFQTEQTSTQWRGWVRAQGADLWRYCMWNALADRFGTAWRQWPADVRHPDSPAVADLPLRDHDLAASCEFHAWVQWLADRELERTSTAAGVALIGDLAVGCASDGADAWMLQDLLTDGASIGAPPDPFNARGQDWGLPPFIPSRLRAAGYAPFIQLVRAAMRHMGGLRIDHVMGLFRQFWVPRGGSPADGAYVRLPSDELLAIIRIEAERAGAFVIGEDLGTVEPEVHQALGRSGILGTKVWWFDQHVAGWATANLATVTTHDLPTVAGVWWEADGDAALHSALSDLAPGLDAAAATVRVHAAVAASPAQLVMATTDDLAGMLERPNRPGTSGPDEPNWRRRLGLTAEQLVTGSPGAAIVAALRTRPTD